LDVGRILYAIYIKSKLNKREIVRIYYGTRANQGRRFSRNIFALKTIESSIKRNQNFDHIRISSFGHLYQYKSKQKTSQTYLN